MSIERSDVHLGVLLLERCENDEESYRDRGIYRPLSIMQILIVA